MGRGARDDARRVSGVLLAGIAGGVPSGWDCIGMAKMTREELAALLEQVKVDPLNLADGLSTSYDKHKRVEGLVVAIAEYLCEPDRA